jgi:hypothetical protein
MGLRKEASPIELMISWLTLCGGREPTKTILIPRRMRKRTGKVRSRVLIFRKDFLSLRSYQNIIEEKLPLHNIQVFKQHLMSSPRLLIFSSSELTACRPRSRPRAGQAGGLKTPNYPFYSQH